MWEHVLDLIRSKLNKQVFEAWFNPVSMEDFSNDTLTLQVPNKFFKEWLSNNYIDLIQDSVFVHTGIRAAIKWTPGFFRRTSRPAFTQKHFYYTKDMPEQQPI